ncbi:MAG: RHS repeat-associated core domain-containing protein, partial [Phycisphaerales bacterium]|nr:RHS repeat-associated core domain-containing protein [Phycisphaerales bacterium]
VEEQYDARNRLAAVLQDGSPIAWYTYEDPSDRLISKRFANGTETLYTHNENDWVKQVRHLAPDGATTFAGFAYDHDATGNPLAARNLQETITFANAKPVTHSERYGYDRAYRLVDFKRGQMSAGEIPSPRRHRTWQLDGVQNWTAHSINDLDTGENADYCNSVNQMNEYDDLSTDGPPAIPDDDGLPDDFMLSPCDAAWSADLAGETAAAPFDLGSFIDRTAADVSGGTPGGAGPGASNGAAFARFVEGALRGGTTPLGATGFNRAHDKNGNLVDDGTRRFYYDHDDRPIGSATSRGRNRLTRVEDSLTGATLGEYRYDALGRRVSASTPSTGGPLRAFCYSAGPRVIETHEDGSLARDFVYGDWIDEVLSMERASDGSRFYFHEQMVGSVIAVTDGDGLVAERYAFDAYGTPSFADAGGQATSESAVGNPYLFTGRRLDPETGLYFYRSRHYDPVAGRFISNDSAGAWHDQVSLGNTYAYAAGNPIARVDSFGTKSARPKPPDRDGKKDGEKETTTQEGLKRYLAQWKCEKRGGKDCCLCQKKKITFTRTTEWEWVKRKKGDTQGKLDEKLKKLSDLSTEISNLTMQRSRGGLNANQTRRLQNMELQLKNLSKEVARLRTALKGKKGGWRESESTTEDTKEGSWVPRTWHKVGDDCDPAKCAKACGDWADVDSSEEVTKYKKK